jgi:cytoskeletal protein RodZ
MKTTDQSSRPSSQSNQPEKTAGKKASFTLIFSTIAVVLTGLLVAAIYYFNTNTHLTP